MTDQDLDKILNKIKNTPPSVDLNSVEHIVNQYASLSMRKKLFTYSLNSILIGCFLFSIFKLCADNEDTNLSIANIENEIKSIDTNSESLVKTEDLNTNKENLLIVDDLNKDFETNVITVVESKKTTIEEIKTTTYKIENNEVESIEKPQKTNDKNLSEENDNDVEQITKSNVNQYEYVLNSKMNQNDVSNFVEKLEKAGLRVDIQKEKYDKLGNINKIKGTINKTHFEADNFEKVLFLMTGAYNQCQISVIDKREIIVAKKDKDRTDKRYHVGTPMIKKPKKRGKHWTSSKK